MEKEITSELAEIEIPGLTSKQKNFRKTAFNYERITEKDTSGIQDRLILEINSFANPIPYSKHSVSSFIAKYLVDTGNEELIRRYQLESFDLLVLDPMVTLIEKILSLVRLSFYDNGVDRIRAKVRHFYDIYSLTNTPEFHAPANSSTFKAELLKLFEEEKTRFHDPEIWLKSHYSESPLFKDFEGIWKQVRGSYDTDFRLLVHGEFPDSDQILKQMIFLVEFLS